LRIKVKLELLETIILVNRGHFFDPIAPGLF
jgi:hypothetical protein